MQETELLTVELYILRLTISAFTFFVLQVLQGKHNPLRCFPKVVRPTAYRNRKQ